MKAVAWYGLFGAFVLFWALVFLVGFEGPVALTVNFFRVTLAVAVLIIYVPVITTIFQEVPPPRRDYLLAGIILSWASALLFAIGNEAGRIFDIDMSIFLNPIAGFFSLLLVSGGVFHIIAPPPTDNKTRIYALIIGVLISIGLVFIAPLFR